MEFNRTIIESIKEQTDVNTIKQILKSEPEWGSFIYPDSVHRLDDCVLFIIKGQTAKKLVAVGGQSAIFTELEGVIQDGEIKICDLNVANSKAIRNYFPFTEPVSLASHRLTMGLGDRLGKASAGHLRVIKKYNVRPVLAQQSIRELNLTGRNYAEVLSDAVWAVFQEDYQGGYGADGDHLKTIDDIQMALDNGFTMITLDCSEYIRNIDKNDEKELFRLYQEFAPDVRKRLEERFLDKSCVVNGVPIAYNHLSLMYNTVVYQNAIDFIIKVYHDIIKSFPRAIDFEVSIDETQTPTDLDSHYFVAAQLMRATVRFNSLAPRFCGEFQKGIDYIGEIDRFDQEFKGHVAIARFFGYKLSIHSGSDKFSVFPIIGHETEGYVHVKTAGTNWLEAMRVIAAMDPGLYREIHQYALDHFTEATKYYHVTTNLKRIPLIKEISDEGLKELLNQNDARQLLHITYGLILNARDEEENYLYRDRFFDCLYRHEDVYNAYLQQHIGKHLLSLVYSFRESSQAM